MMIPEGTHDGNTDLLQKIYFATTPFNLILNKYFQKCGDNKLNEYIDKLAEELVQSHDITSQDIINQIEKQYSEYLIQNDINNVIS